MTNLVIGINGAKFDTSKPAFASFWTNLDKNGNVVISTLHFTGKSDTREEFGEKFTEYEMMDDYGSVNYVSEADLYQRGNA